MERPTDQIEQHIEREREALRSNLEELHHRVTAVVDWRQQFHRNPAALLSIAFSGGLLIALTTGRRTGRRPPSASSPVQVSNARDKNRGRQEISRAWESIQGALIGAAVSKLQDLLVNLTLGFTQRFIKREGGDYPAHAATARRNYRRDVH